MSTVTIKNNPLSLVGAVPKVGEPAPKFTVTNQEMAPVTLSDLSSKVIVLLSVPSLDTPVCDLEARRFNNEAKNLGTDVGIVVISMDLPFAQKRWCGANGIENVKVFSDYKDRDFGLKYGVLIKEIGLLARCVFILDENRIVRYVQLVKEITDEPNYEDVLTNIKKLL
jgi:thiol peroxidase